MKPVTASVAITLEPLRVHPPAPPYTYLGIAENFLPGIRSLACATPSAPLPLAMLCAHALECILKAYLSRSGDDACVRKKDLRHNISGLWSLAYSEGLLVEQIPPDWARCLGQLHDSPYHLRYSTGVHGMSTPASEPMVTALGWLLEQVRAQL